MCKKFLILYFVGAYILLANSCTNKVSNIDNRTEDTIQVECDTTGTSAIQPESDSFENKMQNPTWVALSEGFSLPDFMNTPTETYVEDVPAEVITYKYDDVELCYWPLLGNWALREFPSEGCYVSSEATIRDITYKQESKGIYSGYTSDGRIYYLKIKVTDNEEIQHLIVLALIYPKAQQDAANKIIKSVQSW